MEYKINLDEAEALQYTYPTAWYHAGHDPMEVLPVHELNGFKIGDKVYDPDENEPECRYTIEYFIKIPETVSWKHLAGKIGAGFTNGGMWSLDGLRRVQD